MAKKQRRFRRGELALEILEGLLKGTMLTIMIVAALSGGAVGFQQKKKESGESAEEYEKNINKDSLYKALRRLKKQGMIVKRGKGWLITKVGKEYVKEMKKRGVFWSPQGYPKEKSEDQFIFIFDIPEHLRAFRKRVRAALVLLGFSMLQKSVWIGNTKIPREFLEDMTDWKVMRFIHIFTVKKRGTLGAH